MPIKPVGMGLREILGILLLYGPSGGSDPVSRVVVPKLSWRI